MVIRQGRYQQNQKKASVNAQYNCAAYGSRRKAHGIKARLAPRGAGRTVKTLEGGRIGLGIFKNLGFGSGLKIWRYSFISSRDEERL